MDVTCSAIPCPVLLSATCVFYQGANLVYTGINNNDNLEIALQKIDAKFQDAGLGYIFQNGIIQLGPGLPVGLGGSLVQDTLITGAFKLSFSGEVEASKLITTGGSSGQFVKGDGSLDSTAYQPTGNYISALTGDGVANGPGSAIFTLVNTGVIANTYGSATRVPIITVDTKGRITNLTTTLITVPSSLLIFGGDVTGSGNTGSSVTLTLQTVNSNVYVSNTFLKFAVNGKGLVTSAAPITNLDIESVLGYIPVPSTRTITINGITQNLANNRSWTIPGTLPPLTAGSVLFSDGTTIAQDNALFFWDDTNNRLGIGNAIPAHPLDVTGVIRGSSDAIINGLTVGKGFTNNASATAFGVDANSVNTSLLVTAFGYQALKNNTSGNITAVGHQAGFSNTIGINNAAFGYQTLYTSSAGSQNTALGSNSMTDATSSYNLGAGYRTLRYLTTGGFNTAVGATSSLNIGTGIYNTAVGYAALAYGTLGNANSNNAVVGLLSLGYVVGNNNTAIGYQSGRFLSNGITNATAIDNSIFIGYNTKVNANSQTNQIVIGYNETGLGSNTTILGNSSTITTAIRGNLLLGTTTDAGQKLQVTGTAIISSTTTLSVLAGVGSRMVVADAVGELSTTAIPSLTGYVPYTGATTNLDLGLYNLTATQIIKAGGTSSEFLKADGSVDSTAYGTFTLPSLTSGSVLFSNGTTIAQDNANFFWDDTNNRLGVGTATPAGGIDINNTGTTSVAGRLTFGNDNSAYSSLRIYSGGTVGFTLSAHSAGIGYLTSGTALKLTCGGATPTQIWLGNGSRLWLSNTAETETYIKVTSTGNTLIGTPTEGTGKLQVLGLTTLTGISQISAGAEGILDLAQTWNTTGVPTAVKLNITNTASGTNALLMDLQVGGVSAFKVDKAGGIKAESIYASTAYYINSAKQAWFANVGDGQILYRAKGFAAGYGHSFTDGYTMNGTSGNQNFIQSVETFNPTSGTAVYNHISATPTINQTGGANGITRGLYINPTLTAAADFRAIETTAGKVVFNGISDVLVGTSTSVASARMVVESTTQGFLPPRMTQAQRVAIGTPAVGLMVYQTDGTEGIYVVTSIGWKALTMV